MAGGNITRIVGGKNSIETEEWIVHTNKFRSSANKGSYFTAKGGTILGTPKDPPPAGTYFVKGWWTDDKDKPIKEALIGDVIRFHIQTQNIPEGKEITFTVYDWDGLKIMNDKLTLTDKNTKQESAKIKIQGNRGYIEWQTGDGTQSLLEENLEGDEIELFVECTYDDETLSLPEEESNYLVVYEKEVLITVLIELPHSYYTLLNNPISALGLAGHSAMAIEDRYFDYGPDYSQTIVNEKQYDYDFNNDGDKDDNVDLKAKDKNGKPIYTINEKFSPGRPWWGEMVAGRLGISPDDVKLNQVLDFIKLYWDNIIDPATGRIINLRTNIYGEVHKTEFYVKESEAKKMIKWWEERYKHLKVYSVWPWTGEQCTTTVKTAIQEAFPFDITKLLMSNHIPDTTQMPSGLLKDLKSYISTSKQHNKQLAKQIIIKNEATDYPKKP